MKNKKFLIFSLLLILFFGACQKSNDFKLEPNEVVDGLAPTPLNFFNEKLGFKNLVSQSDSKRNATRYLIKFDSPAEKNGLYKYLLVETSLANRHSVKTFIISDSKWAGSTNLFAIKMIDNTIIYQFTDPGNNKKIAGKQKKNDTTIRNTANRPPTDSYNNCQQIDWYLVTIDKKTGEVLGERYVGSSFECENVSGGSGGSGSGSAQDGNVDGVEDVCDKSFKFSNIVQTSNGVGGWQVAATSNIHMNIVNTTNGEFEMLKLPTIYLGLPIIRSNGEFYSASYAAELAARAVDKAEHKVMDRYHTYGVLDIVGMTLLYRQYINEELQKLGGSATLSPPAGAGNIPVTKAIYSGFLGLNCL